MTGRYKDADKHCSMLICVLCVICGQTLCLTADGRGTAGALATEERSLRSKLDRRRGKGGDADQLRRVQRREVLGRDLLDILTRDSQPLAAPSLIVAMPAYGGDAQDERAVRCRLHRSI